MGWNPSRISLKSQRFSKNPRVGFNKGVHLQHMNHKKVLHREKDRGHLPSTESNLLSPSSHLQSGITHIGHSWENFNGERADYVCMTKTLSSKYFPILENCTALGNTPKTHKGTCGMVSKGFQSALCSGEHWLWNQCRSLRSWTRAVWKVSPDANHSFEYQVLSQCCFTPLEKDLFLCLSRISLSQLGHHLSVLSWTPPRKVCL